MNTRNNPMSQYSRDSMNMRNNSRWDAVVVDLRDPSRKRLYLRETKNNRNNLSGSSRYYNQVNDPHEEPDSDPVLLVPVKEW